MKISIIAAKSKNGVIGFNGTLPWNIPEDWNYFLKKTEGKHVIMGKKTYEDLPSGNFNGWTKLVLSKASKDNQYGNLFFCSLQSAIRYCYKVGEKEIFIIGGERPFREGLSLADNLYLTIIQENFQGDRYFPKFDKSKWILNEELRIKSKLLELNFMHWIKR